MATTTKAEKRELVEQARASLAVLKPGDTVYTILKHRSQSGMMRHIAPVIVRDGVNDDISWETSSLLNMRRDPDSGGVKVGGVGMDMGFLVYELSSALFPQGFDCAGEKCPANDHSNARRGSCLLCGAEITNPPAYTRKNRGWDFGVCSQACASATWHHNDGGYALVQRWL